MLKRYYIYFVIFIVLFLPYSFINADDLSGFFAVNEVRVCDDQLCNVVYDDSNGVRAQGHFLIKFSWSIHTSNPIKDGDTVEIGFANNPSTENSTKFIGVGFSWTDIFDINNNKIGQWMITGETTERKILIRFSDNSVGKSDLNGMFETPKNFYSGYTYKDKIVPLTVGNVEYNLKIKTYKLKEETKTVYHTVNASSDSARVSILSPFITVRQLYDKVSYPNLTNEATLKNLLLEVPLPNSLNASIKNVELNYTLPHITDIVEHKISNSYVYSSLDEKFTKVMQNSNESYDEFKNRLNKFEYGIYKTSNNQTVVINFGSQPSLDITYSELVQEREPTVSEIGDYLNLKIPFTIDLETKNVINELLGSSNEIGGKVALFSTDISLGFPSVATNTEKKIDAIWSWNSVEGEAKRLNVLMSFTLSPPSSMVEVKETSKLLLRDLDSKDEIIGAIIKLQKQNGDSFVDVGEEITDSSGVVTFSNLESGVYRYIQTGYLDHYLNNSFKMYSDSNMTNVIETFNFDSSRGSIVYATNEREKFTISYMPGEHGSFSEKTYNNLYYGDVTPEFEAIGADGWIFKGWSPDKELFVTDNQTYIAQWMKYVKVTTKYIDLNTGNSIAEDVEDISLNDTDYSTNKKDIENYEFVRVEGDESGNRGENDIVVTYYYQKKKSNLTIRYKDCSSTNEIAQSTSDTLYYGDNYDADNYERNVSIPENYNRTAASKSNNYRGVVSNDNIKVDYCYNKKDSNVNTEMVLTGTDKITSSSDKVSYKIDYNALFTDYIGNYNITIVDTLPYKIDVTNSNLDGGIYDENNKTITWNISGNINSYQNDRYSVIKNIDLKFISIDLNEDLMTNHVSGKIVTDDKNVTVETNHNTYIDVVGTINIKYINDLKEELIPSIESTGKVGKEYEITKKDIEGYKIVKEPDNNKYKYIEGNIDLEFVYERIKYKIVVKSLNEGGKVSGDEEVYYKEDSKEDNINIEANDGYYISNITINDKKIKIPDKKTKLTLPKFTKLDEDKYINVSFEKYSDDVVVPNTLKNSILKTIGIIVVLSSIGFILYILYKSKIIFNKKASKK